MRQDLQFTSILFRFNGKWSASDKTTEIDFRIILEN